MKMLHPRIRERIRRFFAVETDRPLYVHGPFIRVVMVIQLFSAVLSVVALILAIVLFSGRFDRLQESRIAAATDTCQTLRQVVSQAYKPPPHGRIILPAVLGTRHATVTFTTRRGRRIVREEFAGPSHVHLTIIEHRAGSQQAQRQIKADDLSNCAAHARRITALR